MHPKDQRKYFANLATTKKSTKISPIPGVGEIQGHPLDRLELLTEGGEEKFFGLVVDICCGDYHHLCGEF